MKGISLARKYSKALVETVKDEKELETIKKELNFIMSMINKDENMKVSMETPLLSYSQKIEVLDIFKDKANLSDKVYKFFIVVIEENRMIFLEKMIELIDECWYQMHDMEKLKVYSAYPLDSAMENELLEKLQKVFNKKIVLEKEIDKTLIAGIKVERGSIYYDFSIEGNLKKLKESLISGFSTQEN